MLARNLRLGGCCAWALALIGASAAAQPVLGGSLLLTNDSVFRGVLQARGRPSLQADLHASLPQGWYAGLWAAAAPRAATNYSQHELDLYAGLGLSLAPRWAAGLRLVHYRYADSGFYGRADADEISASLRFEDRLSLSVGATPNAGRRAGGGPMLRRATRAYELAARQPLAWRPGWPLALQASLGYYDTRALLGEAYWAWDLGLVARLGAVELGLARFDSSAAARRIFGAHAAQGRWALSAAWKF